MPKASQSDQISAALAKIRAPLFLARWSDLGGTPHLVLHTAESRSANALGRQAGAVLKSAGIDCALKVVVHRPNKLTRFRSLEGLMKRLHGGAIVYDPTQFVGRSEAIVKLGVALRRALPEKIVGLFIEAERRTLYVLVDRDSYAKDGDGLAVERGNTTSTVAETFVRWQAANNSRFELATRIGFEPPAGTKLISVDTLTVRRVVRTLLRRGITRNAIKVGAASLFGLGALVPAFAGGPAVSEPNFSAIMAGKLFEFDPFWANRALGVASASRAPYRSVSTSVHRATRLSAQMATTAWAAISSGAIPHTVWLARSRRTRRTATPI